MKTKKFDKCEIEFTNDRCVFYPGEQLHGTLHLHLNRSMDMECIEISCKGKLKTEWKNTYYNEEHESYKIEFESKDKIFEDKQKVFGNGKERTKLDNGEYSYPFMLNLPQGIPSSYEGDYGYIRYQLTVKVKKSWKKDLKLKKMFVVNEFIDSNQGIYRGGPGENDEKTLGFLCCASGPLTLSANLDRAGYCSGETILVTAKVGNNTSRDMDNLEAKLIQKVEFVAHSDERGSDQKVVENVISHIKSGKIEEGKTFEWSSKPLIIPPTVPTLLNNKYIKIKYFVHIWLDVPMGFDLEFKLPITIATIPYLPGYGAESDAVGKSDVKPAKCGSPPVAFLGYPDMVPYLYAGISNQKAVKLNKEGNHKEYQDDKYTPVYTYAVQNKKPENKKDSTPQPSSRSGTPQETAVDSVMPPIE